MQNKLRKLNDVAFVFGQLKHNFFKTPAYFEENNVSTSLWEMHLNYHIRYSETLICVSEEKRISQTVRPFGFPIQISDSFARQYQSLCAGGWTVQMLQFRTAPPHLKCPKPVGTEAQLRLQVYTLMTSLTELLKGLYPVDKARCWQLWSHEYDDCIRGLNHLREMRERTTAHGKQLTA